MKQLVLALSILAISAPAIAQPRSVVLHKGVNTYRVMEGTAIAAAKGDYIELDSNIGIVQVMSPTAYMWFSRLGSRGGGRQTVLVIRSGIVFGRVRRFTNKASYFAFADYYGRSALARGTEYLVKIEEGRLVAIVESSKVIVNNGKEVTMDLLSGQGATVSDDGVRQFRLRYDLPITLAPTRIFPDGRTNIFSGWIEPYMEILSGDGTVLPNKHGYFQFKSDRNNYQLIHPFGLRKTIYPKDAAKPFYGH